MYCRNIVVAALVSSVLAQQTPSLLEALNSTSDLSMLNQLIGSNAQLAQTLGGLTNITVLAPNNAAIEAFTRENNASLSNAELIAATLTYHVLNGTYSNFTENATFIPTALVPGQYANVTGGQVVEARIVNGTGTIFSGYKYNSTVVGDAVNVTGGVVHVIDRVLTIPGTISSTATELGLSAAAGALVNASLVETVDTTPNITLFAPNNAAFQAIGSAVRGLTTQQLASILQYHVVPQVAYSSSLSNTTLTTLGGGNVTITVNNATSVYVNNARVLIADVLVANGVVHVIDEVLNPDNTTATPDEPNFPGASSVSETPYATEAPTPSRSINPSNIAPVTSTTSPGVAWAVKPTGMAAALLAGAVLLL